MAYDYIKRGKAEENGYTNTKVFKMFGISSTGYYDYVARKEDRSGKLAAKRRDENYVIRCFKRIIRRLGFVPGKRTFRRHMFRRFNYKISVSRTSKIMKKMQITAQLPKKDAYKGQATHHHECMAKPNLVNRNFKLGVRQVACVENATVPCIETGTGICHVYVDEFANLEKAVKIIINAKTSRPSVCNAEEVCLVHRAVAEKFLPMLKKALVDDRQAAGQIPVELRLDPAAARIIPGTPASERDFDTEFLDYILAVAVVDSVDAATAHILQHSTGHSEAIVTENAENARRFEAETDSAAVYVNVSTRFTDGGEFGLGCEMGISTQKLHARGPMGLDELSTYKYIIHGNGQTR